MIADVNKKSLIIVESPTKAKTISKYLKGYPFTVVASKGHIVDLNPTPGPEDGVYGVFVDDDFKLDYVIVEGKEKLIAELKKELKGMEQLILASDEDREGESIAWHLYNQLNPTIPTYRMVFHEITKKAIEEAFQNCREIDMNLFHAQESRRVVDRLQGFGISPLLSRKLGGKYSAGRVQSPALKMVVEREKLRRDYKESSYSSVKAIGVSADSSFPLSLVSISGKNVATSNSYDKETGEIKKDVVVLGPEDAKAISEAIKGRHAKVDSVISKNKNENPAIPFTTSTLQQDATRKLGKSTKEIMSIAQRLYENGFITYMRTDSPNLSSECIAASRAQIEHLYGKEYLSDRPRNYSAKSKGAQEAHEAIRPAGDKFRTPQETGLSGDDLKLYALIWRRTLATQMKECFKSTTTVQLSLDDYLFSATGTTIIFKGFRKIYEVALDEKENEEEEGVLPQLEAGCEVYIESAESKDHTTNPPSRFNEATLVQKLESEGIGRPSTYATIISTLLDKKYIIREGNSLVPTFTGFFVEAFLNKTFGTYVDYGFTKTMEDDLDEIASGELDKVSYLRSFWEGRDDFKGLKMDLNLVKANTRAGEVKDLSLSGLEHSFIENQTEIKYEIKTGKFGPYISSDFFDSETGKMRMASIDEKKYFPGTFSDEDAKNILFPEAIDNQLLFGKYQVKSGKFGTYLEREDGKRATWPSKRQKPENAEEAYLDMLFELPKVIGQDEEGNEAVLKLGPYGFYAQYKGENVRVVDPMTVTMDAISAPKKGSLDNFGEYEGSSIEIVSGRYGAYIKWGDKNIALPAQLKRNTSSLTREKAIELIQNHGNKEGTTASEKEFTLSNGETVQLLNGRYGYYLKHGKDNIAISKEEKENPSILTPERVEELVLSFTPKAKTTKKTSKKK